MDQASAQTEKISTYETSRTRRSIVDGNIHSDDSNNDEEYASSGFYVREKTTDKKQDATNVSKETDKECKENGLSAKSPSMENGENSDDGESSKDSKKDKNLENVDEKIEGVKTSNEKVNKSSKKEDKSKGKEMENSVKEKTDLQSKESNNEKEYSKDKKGRDSKKDKSLENIDGKEDLKISNEKVNKQKKKDDKSKEKDSEKIDLPKESNGKEHPKDKEDSGLVIEIKTEKPDENETEKGKTKKDKDKKNDKEINDTTTNGEKEPQQDDTIKENLKRKTPSPKPAVKENDTNNIEKAKDDENKGENMDVEDSANNGDNEAKKDDKSDNAKKTNSEKDDKSKNEDGKNDEKSDASDGSILTGQLEKNPNENVEETAETEMEMDEDFDPSLLCPDISMDVDEAPVITSNPENIPDDGSTSPLPYEATFSTLVDEITGAEVQVDLTPEEMEMRQQMYGPNNPVQKSKIHCTACNIHLGSALTGANNRFVHPLLKVLICKNCYHFYTSGEFEKDEDGSELYCRWCGQGGQVLCCSSCEFVFCKRCIRNNFGPKKFKEIRDSDDWNCFRCDRIQLSSLRASCAEFMEYYRTELARAQALSQTHPELMTTDHTTCCKGGSEKKDETKTPTGQKGTKKKRKDEEDPDYHPVLADPDEPPKKKFGSSTSSGGPGYTVIPPANSVKPILPRPIQGTRPVGPQGPNLQNQGQVFKVGNTTFRARAPSSGPGYTIQRPSVNSGQKSNSPGYITIPPSAAPKTTSPGYITIPPSAAPKTTSPGYIKILPQRMQGPRATSSYTVVSGQKSSSPGYTTIPPSAGQKNSSPGYTTIPPSAGQKSKSPGYITIPPSAGTNNGKPTFTTVRPKQVTTTPAPMKHEWFEKTVRAAARVNSNLSYTLTQLNRQQSQATSVEGLAMVHNKLQEVLSTSINSLIQIRKNLRTEFIAGIKNIKFPPKPAPIPPTSGPIIVKDDDDVIFVSTPKTTTSLPSPPPLVLSPSVTLTKKTPSQNASDPFENPQPSTSGISGNKSNTSKESMPPLAPVKGGFLKVRSFTSLQTVPSECITIPDDPPPSNGNVEIIEEEDPLKLTEPDISKVVDIVPEVSNLPKENVSTFDETMVYNIKEDPSPAIKRMMGAHVMVRKSRVIDEIFRAQGMFNGKDNKTKTDENEKSIIKEKDSKKKDDEKEVKKDDEKEVIKDSEINEEEKDNEKTDDNKCDDKSEEKQEIEKTKEESDKNIETEKEENKKETEGETAKEECEISETA